MTRIRAVAFDVIETCLSLEPLRARLMTLGLQPADLELWFARSLRDAFASEAAGRFVPFKLILAGTLRALLASRNLGVHERRIAHVLESFGELPVHPDVWAAFERVRSAGVKLALLTNGSAETTRQAFDRAGLHVDEIVSVDDVRHFKPAREVYLHAAKRLGVHPSQLALVAAHAWDVQGAREAGLQAAFVTRNEPRSNALLDPDGEGNSLVDALNALGIGARPRHRAARRALQVGALAAAGLALWRTAAS